MQIKLVAVLALTLLSTLNPQLSTAFAQGALTPPGAPGPTMKTLNQIEPRTPISVLPYNITAAGSYYLTTNLTGVPGTNGITIGCGNVAIDLRGFTLSGVPGSLDGINVSAPYNNITVENGTVSDWDNNGINADNVSGGLFSQLILADNDEDGLNPGRVSQVLHCIATGNTWNGYGGFCSNTRFEGCVGTGNAADGFDTFEGCSLLGCSANLNGLDGFVCFVHCVVKDCVAHDDGFDGIDMPYGGGGGVVAGCVCNNNGSQGILRRRWVHDQGLRSPRGIRSQRNRCTGSEIVRCWLARCETNGAAGIFGWHHIPRCKDCTASFNVNNGIQASTGCRIEHNTCSGNGGGNPG
jgi:hypothetical protein